MTGPVCPWCGSTPPHHERCEMELLVWQGSHDVRVETCACDCRTQERLW